MFHRNDRFISNRFRGLLIGLGIISLASYMLIVGSTQPATAHQDPANCNTNSVGISLTPFISGVPTGGPVQHGDVITYQVTLSVPAGGGGVVPCSVSLGQLSVTLPNGTVVQVAGFGGATPDVPLVNSGTPYIVNAPTTYTVAHANEDGSFNIKALADYGSTTNQPGQTNGTFHASVHQQTASATTSNILHVIHTPTVTSQVHDPAHTDITNTSVPIGTIIHDKAIVTGAAGTPTGTVDFLRYTNDSCDGNPADTQNNVILLGNGTAESSNFTTNASGGLSYKVHYDGDDNYLAGDGPCELLTVNKLTPTVNSEIHDPTHAVITTTTVGTVVHDKALITGSGPAPTGTVDFSRFTNDACTGEAANIQTNVALSGSPTASAESNTFTTVAGGMAYKVHYDGDGTYEPGDGPCEPLTVNKLRSTTTSEVHNPSHTDITNQTVPVGTIVHDKAIVSGSGPTPSGTVDFKRYSTVNCSGASIDQSGVPLVSGAAESNTFTTVAGDMAYLVHYNGNSIYDPSDGPCEPLHVERPTGCTFTQGYWKNHASAWPVSTLFLGTVSYNQSQLLSILKAPVKGNGLISLSHQLIAAKLNIANGASPSSIAATIISADTLIGSQVVPPVGSGFISPSTTSSLNDLLDQFNSGLIGPGHCRD